MSPTPPRDLERAATRGEPSYVWRAGQERRLALILAAAGERASGRVLDDGCGVGQYLAHLGKHTRSAFGLEFDPGHARSAGELAGNVVRGAGEALPYPTDSFDLVLSHEVLEHVADDRAALEEIARVLRRPTPAHAGGRVVLFVPEPRLSFRNPRRILARPVPVRQYPLRELPAAFAA